MQLGVIDGSLRVSSRSVLWIILLLVPALKAADDVTLSNRQLVVSVRSQDGAFEIRESKEQKPVICSGVAAQINHHWIRSSEYPTHRVTQESFEDVLGYGQKLTVTFGGLASRPTLIYKLRIYDLLPFGDLEVQVQNGTTKTVAVESIREVEAFGDPLVDLGELENYERVLSDTFSESNVQVYDLGHVAEGLHRAIGSQLIYNRNSRQSLLFGALSADRFLTILRLQVENLPSRPKAKSYTIDATGTTEIRLTAKWFRQLPPEDHVELSLPIAAGTTLSAEPLMFAVGNDYHAQLENYGAAIRRLHHARVNGDSVMGWWGSPAEYNSSMNEGQAHTNAEWLAQHLKPFGYEFFDIDCSYTYSLGEYTVPDAAMFPHGMRKLGNDLSRLGLKPGLWVAPLAVGEKSWVYEHHKDWLVRNARGMPIKFPAILEVREPFFVLDATHPGAQEYLRQTYRTLTREWGLRYIKLDYMDITAVEGYYHRPHTSAIEALKTALQVIRDAVGDDVLLDKDGSPMLTPVGLVDEGRISRDAAHSFSAWKQAAPPIFARYYMHRNFFVNDPDAFTLLKEVQTTRDESGNPPSPPLTLDEAEISITLAAITGGMFEIGDDLPSLANDVERLALLTNKDLLQMVKLGRAARPLDLLEYSPDDLQPSITLLREDDRQSMLAVFNWTEQPRSHSFRLEDLGLPEGHAYKLYGVFNPHESLSADGTTIPVNDQRPHSVRLIKIVDESQPTAPPKFEIDVPKTAKVNETVSFTARSGVDGEPLLDCHWDFGDGITAVGAKLTHAYTLAGTYTVKLTIDGLDDVPGVKTFQVTVDGQLTFGPRTPFTEGRRPGVIY